MTPVALFDAEKTVEAVGFYVFRIIFTASLFMLQVLSGLYITSLHYRRGQTAAGVGTAQAAQKEAGGDDSGDSGDWANGFRCLDIFRRQF